MTQTERPPPGIEQLLDSPVLATIPDVAPPVLPDESVARAYDALASAILSKHL